MLEACLLGTGGMMPLPYRYLTSLLLRYNGSSLMIDCGEGTQMALRKKGFSSNPVDVLCFTHYHGDHISGLPGLLLTMGNAERTEDLHIVGPKGLERVVNALRVVAPELPFNIVFHEFTGDQADFRMNGYRIHAFKVQHNVPCYGYTVSVDRLGLFDPERARDRKVPLRLWNRLQHGESVTEEGILYTPEMVMGPARKGLKLCYVTDSRPVDSILENAEGADLFICEGMYGEEDKLDRVREHRHMLMQEACELAKGAGVKELWFTHYSPAMNHPEQFGEEMQKLFSGAVVARDGQFKDLCFEE